MLSLSFEKAIMNLTETNQPAVMRLLFFRVDQFANALSVVFVEDVDSWETTKRLSLLALPAKTKSSDVDRHGECRFSNVHRTDRGRRIVLSSSSWDMKEPKPHHGEMDQRWAPSKGRAVVTAGRRRHKTMPANIKCYRHMTWFSLLACRASSSGCRSLAADTR
jgi:hypothetical protein